MFVLKHGPVQRVETNCGYVGGFGNEVGRALHAVQLLLLLWVQALLMGAAKRVRFEETVQSHVGVLEVVKHKNQPIEKLLRRDDFALFWLVVVTLTRFCEQT